MNCTVIYGGFNPAWQAGQLERQLIDSLTENLNNQYPNLKKVVAVTSWHEPSLLLQQIQQLNPELTILCSLTDPLGPTENLTDQIPGRVILLGYVSGEYFFDFWAVACNKFFKNYNVEQLEPVCFDKLFLNYNRKPHRHRVELIRLFEQHAMIDNGYITLGNSNYNVGDRDQDYVKFGATDVVGDVGIPNDVYSLGQLHIWNTSFINVVSETQYEFSKNVFLSEKIFKPIIGLRPFVINGSPGIYKILKKYKFDCFEDLFAVTQIENETNINGWKFHTHPYIVQSLLKFKDVDLLEMYHQIKPRLMYNRELFYEYSRNQTINFQF